MGIPLSELKTAHQELMTRYVAVLEEVENAPWLMPVKRGRPPEDAAFLKRLPVWLRGAVVWLVRRSPSQRGQAGALRYLVQLFVEAHVREKLRALADAYLSLRAQASADDKELRDWTKESGEVCEKMAGTLVTWGSIEGAAKLLWPFAVGALTAWLGVKDIWEAVSKLNPQVYVTGGLMLLFPGLYFFIFMSTSFAYKRELFIPGFKANEHPLDPGSAAVPGTNVYVLEDRLFDLLCRKKSRERSWDINFIVISFLIFGSVPILGLFAGSDTPPLSIWLAGGFFVLIAIVILFARRKRNWR